MSLLRLVALALILTSVAHAQSASVWKHLGRPDGGLYLNFLTVNSIPDDSTYQPSESKAIMLGFIGGLNLPFVPLGENLSLGFNPNLCMSYSLSGFPALTFGLPLYATLKWGTDATWQGSKTPVGLTVGVGYALSVLFLPEAEEALSIANPSLLAEFNFGKRRSGVGIIKLRFQTDIIGHTEKYDGGEASYFQYLFGIVFTTGY